MDTRVAPSPVTPMWLSWLSPWVAAALVVTGGVAAYANSLGGPFVYDDQGDIQNNPAVRQLWPLWRPLVIIEHEHTRLHSRPLVMFTFAVNYAMSGLDTRAYHVTNLAIHLLAGLTLLGIVRRTLLAPRQERYRPVATLLALAVALLWTLHPLQTQAVTYIVQRYESLMGLLYLATLYAALRCATSTGRAAWAWGAASVIACLAAQSCKEVAASAPLVVLLFDRAYIAGSFSAAWRRRWGLYLGLAATWLVSGPFFLFFSGGAGLAGKGGFAGFSETKPWLPYALNQPQVIWHYLRLAVWPEGQCLDYAWVAVEDPAELWPSLVCIGGLLVLTIGLLTWRPRAGFLGAWFFLILAPSSSFIPINDLAFEHRMYLPLAAVVVVIVFASFELVVQLQRQHAAANKPTDGALAAWAGAIAIVAVILGSVTALRNQVYADPWLLWSDVAAKRPGNARAQIILGQLELQRGQPDVAIGHYEKAERLVPAVVDDPLLQRDWAAALTKLERLDLAIPHYLAALSTAPEDGDTHLRLSRALAALGYRTAAGQELQAALRLDQSLRGQSASGGEPADDEAITRRAAFAEAIARALGMPLDDIDKATFDSARVEYELGLALLKAGETKAALARFGAAEALHPDAELRRELERAVQSATEANERSTAPRN